MKKFQRFAFIVILLSCASCSQKNKSNQDGSFNDTLAVTKLLVQEIRKDLESKSDVDSIKEFWNGKLCTVGYRLYKEIENSQTISMIFGDINCDSLNDAIATIEYYTGGNRPEFTQLYVERTADGYKVKAGLPLFEYRYVSVVSIVNCVLELNGKAWKDDDPMCCPSINESFKVKLVGETFVKVVENIGNTPDPIAAEFEKAKLVADSIKQKFEFEKHSLLKISFAQESQTEESKSSSTYYFDSLFFSICLVYISEYAGGAGETYNFYYSDGGLALSYSIGNDAGAFSGTVNNGYSYTRIWFKQHQLEEVVDASGDKKYKDDIVNNNNSEEFLRWKQYTDNKSKQEFTYDSDSSWYKLTTQNGDWTEELRLDSALFVHLLRDK